MLPSPQHKKYITHFTVRETGSQSGNGAHPPPQDHTAGECGQAGPEPRSLYLSPRSELDPRSRVERDSSQCPLPSFVFFLESNHQDIFSLPCVTGEKELDTATGISINCVLWSLFSLSSHGRVPQMPPSVEGHGNFRQRKLGSHPTSSS